MTDVIISSFISLFALFGKVEQVDEERAKEMLVSYLRHQFGIRNIDLYLDLYSDMRMAYEMTDDLNTQDTVSSICSSLHGKIRTTEEALLLLRLMEFCSDDGLQAVDMFDTMAHQFHITESQYASFTDYVNELRLGKAYELFATPGYMLSHGISDLAAESGFASVASFRRAFVKKYDETPLFYINKNGYKRNN